MLSGAASSHPEPSILLQSMCQSSQLTKLGTEVVTDSIACLLPYLDSQYTPVIQKALSIIKSIGKSNTHRQKIPKTPGAIEKLLNFIDFDNVTVQSTIMSIYQNMMLYEPARKLANNTPEWLEKCYKQLKSSNTVLQYKTCFTIANLANSEITRERMTKNEWMIKQLYELTLHKDDKIKSEAIRAIANATTHPMILKQINENIAFIYCLAVIINKNHFGLMLDALHAISKVTTQTTSHETLLRHPRLVDNLCMLLNCRDKDVKLYAKMSLNLLIKHPASLNTIIKKISDDTFIMTHIVFMLTPSLIGYLISLRNLNKNGKETTSAIKTLLSKIIRNIDIKHIDLIKALVNYKADASVSYFGELLLKQLIESGHCISISSHIDSSGGEFSITGTANFKDIELNTLSLISLFLIYHHIGIKKIHFQYKGLDPCLEPNMEHPTAAAIFYMGAILHACQNAISSETKIRELIGNNVIFENDALTPHGEALLYKGGFSAAQFDNFKSKVVSKIKTLSPTNVDGLTVKSKIIAAGHEIRVQHKAQDDFPYNSLSKTGKRDRIHCDRVVKYAYDVTNSTAPKLMTVRSRELNASNFSFRLKELLRERHNHQNLFGIDLHCRATGAIKADGERVIRLVTYMPNLGMNLEEYLKTNTDLSPKKRLEILKAIAIQLKRIHRSGQVHLDLKPNNLTINPITNELHIIDLACRDINLPRNKGYLIYTPAFAAPEVKNKEKNAILTREADIYSLGVIARDHLKLSNKFLESMLDNIPEKRPSVGTLIDIIDAELSSQVGASAGAGAGGPIDFKEWCSAAM